MANTIKIFGSKAPGGTINAVLLDGNSQPVTGNVVFSWYVGTKYIAGSTSNVNFDSFNMSNVGTLDGVISVTAQAGAETVSIKNVASLLNAPHTGAVSITGTPLVGAVLTATNTLKDADGLGSFVYKWYADNTLVKTSSDSTYKLAATDLGKTLTASISFTDKLGFNETSSVSKATKVVTASYKTSNLDDILTSTPKLDKLTGGLGSDIFTFKKSSDTGLTKTSQDVITDFNHSHGDKISLAAINADESSILDTPFSAVGVKPTVANTGVGKLWFDANTSILYGSVDADIDPEFSIQLTGVTVLESSDIIL